MLASSLAACGTRSWHKPWSQVGPSHMRVTRIGRRLQPGRAEVTVPGRRQQATCQAPALGLEAGKLAKQQTDTSTKTQNAPITFSHLSGVIDVEANAVTPDMALQNSASYSMVYTHEPTEAGGGFGRGFRRSKTKPTQAGRAKKKKSRGRAKPGPRPNSSNAWNNFQQETKGLGLSRAEVRALYQKQKTQPRVRRSRLTWNHFQSSVAGRGLSNRQVSELYRQCCGDPSKALALASGNEQRAQPDCQRVTLESQVVPFKKKTLKPPVTIPTPSTFLAGVGQLPPELFSPLGLPNLGYACSNDDLRKRNPSVYIMRKPTKATFQKRGVAHVSALALCNCRDLLRILQWNEGAGIRLFRLTLDMLPWCDHYELSDLPDYSEICKALASAGAYARERGHRVTAHASHYVKLASPNPELVGKSIKILERHSALFDLMGYSPSLWNKVNVHIGGSYGDKQASLARFARSLELLSPRCRARLTVENDDSKAGYSVSDLLPLSELTGVPIVFDAHHHKFCDGGMSQRTAMLTAYKTWPKNVRPIIHWSESQEGRSASAHSDYIRKPILLHGLDDDVDVMLEAKGHERAVLRYQEDAMRLKVSHVLGRVLSH